MLSEILPHGGHLCFTIEEILTASLKRAGLNWEMAELGMSLGQLEAVSGHKSLKPRFLHNTLFT